jgi:hypothetical protein
MKREMMRMTVMTGCSLLLCGVMLGGPMATTVPAEVNININVGVPPPIIMEAPPAMIYLGMPGIYVMVGVPYDIFFISARYYYFHGGNWFWAPGYGGPWVHVVYKSLPPGLRKYKIEKLREFRVQEYKVYKAQGPKFKGKHFVAVSGPGGPLGGGPPKGPKGKPGK